MIMESTTKTPRLTKNNSGRHSNRFLQCFRTPEMDVNGYDSDDHVHQQPVFTYVDVGENQAVVFPGILSDDVVDVVGVDVNQGKKKKRVSGRKLVLLMRAVMFETSLAKKIRKKKQKWRQSEDKLLRKPEKSLDGNYLVQESSEDENVKTSSRNSSFVITSSCPSSLSSNPRYRSDRTNSFRSNTATLEGKQDKNNGKGFYGPNIGCCFLLISLFVLVFWGKVCAIVCTSTWLFFVPRRFSSGNVSSLKNVDRSARFGSERYKKKVVMEGLLERNHSRGL